MSAGEDGRSARLTNAVIGRPTEAKSTSARYPRRTPAFSSLRTRSWTEDAARPTLLPTSPYVSRASFSSRATILRSVAFIAEHPSADRLFCLISFRRRQYTWRREVTKRLERDNE